MGAVTKLDEFKAEILTPDRQASLAASLPRHINVERYERNMTNALMQQPELLDFHPSLVFREVSKAAALGLYLDKEFGEAYIVIAYNAKTKRKEPQLRIGYRGLIKLAKQSGKYTRVYARAVHERDYYRVVQGTTERIEHEPVQGDEDRGEVVEYYAVAKMVDGEADFDTMTVSECLAIRDRSDAWKAYQDGKVKSTSWATDEGEMCKKTVIRRLCKRLDQSPELADAIKIEDEAEFPTMRDVTPQRSDRTPPPGPKPKQIAPRPKVGTRTPPSKVGKKRTGEAKPYAGNKAKETEKPQEPESAAYDENESKEQLESFRKALEAVDSKEELIDLVETWRTTVIHQMHAREARLAAASLDLIVEEVFEDDEERPTFVEEGQGA